MRPAGKDTLLLLLLPKYPFCLNTEGLVGNLQGKCCLIRESKQVRKCFLRSRALISSWFLDQWLWLSGNHKWDRQNSNIASRYQQTPEFRTTKSQTAGLVQSSHPRPFQLGCFPQLTFFSALLFCSYWGWGWFPTMLPSQPKRGPKFHVPRGSSVISSSSGSTLMKNAPFLWWQFFFKHHLRVLGRITFTPAM